jgi:hypothetical protein
VPLDAMFFFPINSRRVGFSDLDLTEAIFAEMLLNWRNVAGAAREMRAFQRPYELPARGRVRAAVASVEGSPERVTCPVAGLLGT